MALYKAKKMTIYCMFSSFSKDEIKRGLTVPTK